MSHTLEALRAHDPSDMYSAIAGFATQARDAVEIGRRAGPVARNGIRRVVVLGMGGSAIGGDLFRSYVSAFEARNGIEVIVSRGYRPPPVDASTLLVAASYSGNTEETIEAYERASPRAAATLVITTGGTIGAMAAEQGHATITLPGGLQPRAALAYGFFPLAYVLAVKSGLFGDGLRDATERGIEEAIGVVESLGRSYGAEPGDDNLAYTIATALQGRIAVVYSGSDRLDAVNLRWRGQIQENAKNLAFGGVLPEMNHNEINGWLNPPELARRLAVIFLHDADDHERVVRRLEVTRRIVAEHAATTIALEAQGGARSLLARIFSLVHLGDWTSWWLAVINGQDPMPVPVIENLKVELAGG